jgi:hypothetical protein
VGIEEVPPNGLNWTSTSITSSSSDEGVSWVSSGKVTVTLVLTQLTPSSLLLLVMLVLVQLSPFGGTSSMPTFCQIQTAVVLLSLFLKHAQTLAATRIQLFKIQSHSLWLILPMRVLDI